MNKKPSTTSDRVKRRTVFFIAGFDPKGPAFYHQMFADNAPLQCHLSGMEIEVSKRQRDGRTKAYWTTDAIENDNEVHTKHVVMRFDDLIIKNHWPRGTFRLFGILLSTYWQHLRSGFLRRTLANAYPAFICGTYPAFFVLGTVLLSGLLIFAISQLALGSIVLSLASALIAILLTVQFVTPWLDKKFGVYWLVRIYHFILGQAEGKMADFDDRTSEFATAIVEEAECGDVDEILVIGHSTGAQTGVSILARALEQNPGLCSGDTRISFATLGGSIAMLAWQKKAHWFRDQLQRVADEPKLCWIDFTAPQDGATYALMDPVVTSGLKQRDPENPSPKLLSIRLYELFSPERFLAVRRQWQRIHFQYLMAGETKGEYDFFALSSGCLTLCKRFEHRKSAKNFDRFKIRFLKP